MKLPKLFDPERFLENTNKKQGIRPDTKLAWGTLIQVFGKEQEISLESKEVYLRCMRKFIYWLAQEKKLDHPEQLTREDILSYKSFLRFSNLAPATINNYLIAVKKLFGYLEAKRIFPDISKGIKGLGKPRNSSRSCFSVSQLQAILSGISTDTEEGLRNFAMINLFMRTGLRGVEISRAKIEDLRQESGEAVLWVQGKGRESKDDFVLLVDEALKPLRDYLSKRKPKSIDEPLFAPLQPKINKGTKKVMYTTVRNRHLSPRQISGIAKRAMRQVNIDSKYLTAHSFRHTAITLSIQGGASLEQVSGMARHADIATTMRYFHNLQRVSDAAEKYITLSKYENHLPLTTKKSECNCK